MHLLSSYSFFRKSNVVWLSQYRFLHKEETISDPTLFTYPSKKIHYYPSEWTMDLFLQLWANSVDLFLCLWDNSFDLLTSLSALARDHSSAWPQGFDSLRSHVHGAPQSRQTWTVSSRSPSQATVKQKSDSISPLQKITLFRYTDSLLCNKSIIIIFIFRNT